MCRTTSLWAAGQYERDSNRQKSTMSPTKYSVRVSMDFKNADNTSALQPRLPKWASEMNTVRNWLRFTGGSLGEGPEIVHIEVDLCSDHVWAVQSVRVPWSPERGPKTTTPNVRPPPTRWHAPRLRESNRTRCGQVSRPRMPPPGADNTNPRGNPEDQPVRNHRWHAR